MSLKSNKTNKQTKHIDFQKCFCISGETIAWKINLKQKKQRITFFKI